MDGVPLRITVAKSPGNADEDLMTAALQAGALAYVLETEMTPKLISAI